MTKPMPHHYHALAIAGLLASLAVTSPALAKRAKKPRFMESYAREFWRFVFVQRKVAELAKAAIEFPPMQKGASFNLEAVKAQIHEAVKARHAQ